MDTFKKVLLILVVSNSWIQAQSNCETDSIPPTIKCLPSISIIGFTGEELQLWVTDLTLDISDNCVDDRNDLGYSFAPDSSLISISAGTFFSDCDDVQDNFVINEPLLTQDSIAVYVSDNNGNTSTCKTEISEIRIEPSLGDCTFNYDFEFKVVDVNQNITFERAPRLKIHLPEFFYEKDSIFYVEPTQIGLAYLYKPTNYTGFIVQKPHEHVSVILDFEPLTSKFITVSDLLIIQNHILGLVPFTDDWQFTAADVNSDEKISIQDLLVLRNIILDIQNIIEIPSHKIIPNKNISLINDEFLDTADRNKNLEYMLVRIGDLNDQSNK